MGKGKRVLNRPQSAGRGAAELMLTFLCKLSHVSMFSANLEWGISLKRINLSYCPIATHPIENPNSYIRGHVHLSVRQGWVGTTLFISLVDI